MLADQSRFKMPHDSKPAPWLQGLAVLGDEAPNEAVFKFRNILKTVGCLFEEVMHPIITRDSM